MQCSACLLYVEFKINIKWVKDNRIYVDINKKIANGFCMHFMEERRWQ